MTVPYQPLLASGIGLVSMGGEKCVQFSLNSLRDQLLRTIPQRIGQRIG